VSEQIKCWAGGGQCPASPTGMHSCTRHNEATDWGQRYHLGKHECPWCGERWGNE
jgi:hypothetical protein